MTSADRLILFVVDGMRPDGLLNAEAPAMRRLMERGAYTLNARSIMPSITLPTHMTMFHAVPAEVHGVTSNQWQPMAGQWFPGLVDLLRKEGRKTAAFYTWEELRDLWRPNALVYSSFVNIYGPDGLDSDAAIARLAADYIVRERPDFTFVYLGLVDEIGHRSGWMSPQYLQTVSGASAAIGHILDRLEEAGLLASTTCLLTADHGGHERSHGSDCAEDMTIPWILAGPGVRQGYEISGPVSIADTAPTLAHLLGVTTPAEWQGKPVLEALE